MHKDGRVIWAVTDVIKVDFSGGGTKVVIVQDVTKEKEAFLDVQNAVRVRDEFLSIASHELKTPITALALQAELTLRHMEKYGPHESSYNRLRDFAIDISRQTDRLSKLVEDMLDVSRFMVAEMRLNRESVDLGAMAKEVAGRLNPSLQAAGCELKLKIGENVNGIWDRYRIEQVLTNLLTNAMKYGANRSVVISVSAVSKNAIISVQDFGAGIAEENQDRIFDRFERVGSPVGITGMGLGLFISRQIVESHGGKIVVRSTLGKGSTFSVELPL